jgi:hypothetical protein
VLNVDGTTGECGEKVNLGLVEEVVVLALESGVGLLLNFEHDITGHDTRQLITLAAKLNLVAVLDTLIDVNVEDLALDNGLLSLALPAAVALADNLSFTIAVWADSLEALDHRTHLAHHGLHTGTIAAGTRLDSAFLTTTAIASGTNNGLLKSQLRNLSTVDIFEIDLVNVVDGPGLLRALVAHATAEHSTKAASAAEELGEEILSAHSAGATATLKTLLTKLIIDTASLGIGENFVRFGNFLECLGGLWVVGVLVCTD